MSNQLKQMTNAERLELGKLVRLGAKVAKDDVAQMEARHLADIEAQLAANYSANHSAWLRLRRSRSKP